MNLIFLAQTDPRVNFWSGDNGSNGLWIKILAGFVAGILLIFALTQLPPQFRRAVVAIATFIAGFVYIISWLWPEPVARKAGTLPNGTIEGIGFFVKDSVSVVGDFYNILAGFLLGLGVYSVMRIHLRKLVKMQHDWGFSAVLIISMVVMIIFGYWDWANHQGPGAAALDNMANWKFQNYAGDLLFDGLLQAMDAAMFSVIAFYILSAAYRAFRIRSVEASILLFTALIVILGLMGAVAYLWDTKMIGALTGDNPNSFLNNLKLSGFKDWIQNTFQTSSLRGIDFGVGIGALAMGMRLWLSLERGGVSQ